MRLFLEIIFRGIHRFFTDRHYRIFLFLALRYSGVPRYTPKQVKVTGYHLKVVDCLSFIWQFHDIFVEEVYRFKASEKPVIIDGGSNIGLSCLYFKKRYPQSTVMAFEADPEIFRVLKGNLEKNKIDGVQLHNSALWNDDGWLSFKGDGADTGKVVEESKGHRVKAFRLRNILESTGHVDFLKLDIEGAEYKVLEDCKSSLDGVQNIFIECHTYPGSPQNVSDILSILERNDFRYFIQPVNKRKYPFINKGRDQQMDLQLNVIAYR